MCCCRYVLAFALVIGIPSICCQMQIVRPYPIELITSFDRVQRSLELLAAVTENETVLQTAGSDTNDCGISNYRSAPDGTADETHPDRIMGGTPATHSEFPWQAFLFVALNDGKGAACGGSLIHNRWVLTAAHCLEGASNVTVLLGAHNITDILSGYIISNYEPGRKVYFSKQLFVNPEWAGEDESVNFAGDVGLIKLPSAVPFNGYIRPICLPSVTDSDHVGDSVTLTGWGKTSGTTGQSSVLLKVDSTVMSNEACHAAFPFIDTKKTICSSGAENHGTCSGDSGGPMNYKQSNGTWMQIGVVSFGFTGCPPGKPNGFARIRPYVNWINSTMAQNTSSAFTKRPFDIVFFIALLFLVVI